MLEDKTRRYCRIESNHIDHTTIKCRLRAIPPRISLAVNTNTIPNHYIGVDATLYQYFHHLYHNVYCFSLPPSHQHLHHHHCTATITSTLVPPLLHCHHHINTCTTLLSSPHRLHRLSVPVLAKARSLASLPPFQRVLQSRWLKTPHTLRRLTSRG